MISNHLRYAECDEQRLADITAGMLRSSAVHMHVLEALRASGLKQAMLVSGAIYNFVWNRLTGRDDLTGIKDFDLFYFDAADLSYEAEDREIKRLDGMLGDVPLPVELRNQARVHLWYETKFGRPFPALSSSAESLERFAARTHAVAAWLDEHDDIKVLAPFGLTSIFDMRLVPNDGFINPTTYAEKAARAARHWPELTVEPF